MSLLDDWPGGASQSGWAPGGAVPAGAEPEEDDAGAAPLFSIETLEAKATHGQGAVTAVAAASNCVLLGTATGALIRYDFAEGAATEVELCKPGTGFGVHAIFCDPSARHALVVLRDAAGRPGETVYFHASWRKAKSLARLKGSPPCSVAWRSDCPDLSAREVLLGSTSGTLMELQLDAQEGKRVDAAVKTLCELREREPVKGLHMEHGPPGGKVLVLVVTASRLYCFTGGPGLEAAATAAAALGAGPGGGSPVLQPLLDLPNRLPQSCLHVYGTPGRRAERFAWLGANGVYHGSLASASEGAHSVTPFPSAPPAAASGGGAGSAAASLASPLGFAPTQFHFLFLFPDRLVAINALSSRPSATLPLARHGIGSAGAAALALVPDSQGGALYLASTVGLFEVVTKNEGRDQWRLHLQRREYSEALACAPTPKAAEQCHAAQGEAAFARGEFLAAAQAFARAPTQLPFEDAALRLLRCGDGGALRVFLRSRLDSLGKGDRAAATLLSTWLLELFLHALVSEADAEGAPPPQQLQKGDKPSARPPPRLGAPSSGGSAGTSPTDGAPAPSQLSQQFRSFLKEHAAHLDAVTAQRLLSDFGRADELVYFAELRGDSETVARHHLGRGDAGRCVAALRRPGTSPELFYSTAPQLFALAPEAAVELWLGSLERAGLEAARLVPALAAARGGALGETARRQAVRFLEHSCGKGCTAAGVHNLLLSLHAEAAGPGPGEQPLLRYLRGAGAGGRSGGAPLYDPSFALRTCLQRGALRAAVELHIASGAFDLAVQLALKLGDVPLARAAANRGGDGEDAGEDTEGEAEGTAARRRLWMQIARHVVTSAAARGGNAEAVREAIAFIGEAEGLLRVEDVLQLCPDSACVDDFREAVTSALDAHAAAVTALRREMAEASASAEAIGMDIAALASRQLELPRRAACARCAAPLMGLPPPPGASAAAGVPPFYTYPCSHSFCAGQCLLEAAAGGVGPQAYARARKAWTACCEGSGGEAGGRLAYESLLCAECPLCGEGAARSVTLPFIDMKAEGALLASWSLD